MRITDKEIEVIHVILEGSTIEEAAKRLNLAEGTIRKHLNNIYNKLSVTNRVELQRKAQNLGIWSEF